MAHYRIKMYKVCSLIPKRLYLVLFYDRIKTSVFVSMGNWEITIAERYTTFYGK